MDDKELHLDQHSFDGMFHEGYICTMSWDVEYTNEFGDWWGTLSEAEQESLAASVQLLDIHVPVADRLYEEHLEQLRKEGLING